MPVLYSAKFSEQTLTDASLAMRTNGQSLDGMFWLPGQSQGKLAGKLTIQDSGTVELQIIGSFDSDPSQWNTLFTVPRIVGMVEGELPVTLDRCIYTRKGLPIVEVPKSTLRVGVAFLGVAYDADEQIGFQSFEFSIEGLDKWHSVTGIKVGSSRPPFEISYTQPAPMKLWEDEKVSLSLVFNWRGPSFPATSVASVSQSSKFVLTGRELLSFDQFSTVAYRLVHLLCLATDETVSVCDVVARTPKQSVPDGNVFQPISVDVYYESRSFAKIAPEIDRWDLLFSLGQLPGDTQVCFDRWMDVHARATAAMSLYFSAHAGEQAFLSGRFLSLAQSLETYHRRSFETVRMPREEYERMIKAIQGSCPPEYREFLNGRLMNANEPSQRERFAELLAPFANHFGDQSEQQRLLKWIVDTRNYYTHYPESRRNKAARGRNLWTLCGRMEVLFQLCMLREIGFSGSHIDQIVRDSRRLKNRLSRTWEMGENIAVRKFE